MARAIALSPELFPGAAISVGGAIRHVGVLLSKGLIVLAECGTIVSIGQVELTLED